MLMIYLMGLVMLNIYNIDQKSDIIKYVHMKSVKCFATVLIFPFALCNASATFKMLIIKLFRTILAVILFTDLGRFSNYSSKNDAS